MGTNDIHHGSDLAHRRPHLPRTARVFGCDRNQRYHSDQCCHWIPARIQGGRGHVSFKEAVRANRQSSPEWSHQRDLSD